MRGKLVTRTWEYDPTLYAPARYRRACRYEAFIPNLLAGDQFSLPSRVLGIVSDAEQAIMSLKAMARPALQPLARCQSPKFCRTVVDNMSVNRHTKYPNLINKSKSYKRSNTNFTQRRNYLHITLFVIYGKKPTDNDIHAVRCVCMNKDLCRSV